ncbi:pleiotrophin-like isoform X2 [Ctenocephalides felis]|nr:pleiotrophin-like isoform X2 [Ctenocephalides felis]
MKYSFILFAVCLIAAVSSEDAAAAGQQVAADSNAPGGEIWQEDDREVLIRNERGAKNRESCRYMKGQWSECNSKNNTRSRTLTLKKGDAVACEQTKTVQKKCKKACRYEKGTWGECDSMSQMTRTDTLKSGGDPTCQPHRQVTKRCGGAAQNGGKKNSKANKENKGGRRNRQ